MCVFRNAGVENLWSAPFFFTWPSILPAVEKREKETKRDGGEKFERKVVRLLILGRRGLDACER